MVLLTESERKALLILTKEYTQQYNANSLSMKLGISHVGAQKLLKRLEKEKLIVSKKFSHSYVHTPKLDEEYTRQLITFLLADQAHQYKRWKEEFKSLNENIVMIYGSAITNYQKAADIDIMIIIDKITSTKKIKQVIREIEKQLPKKIHSIILTKEDFRKNLQQKQEAIVNIVQHAIVLYGQEEYVKAFACF